MPSASSSLSTTSSKPGDVLGQLRREWDRAGRTPAARRVVDELRTDPSVVLPQGVVDLEGLVRALEPRGGLDPIARARVVAALLTRANDDLVRRCLLQTLLPGIVSVARQLQFGAGVADSARTFLAEALSEAVELLVDWAGEHRGYAAPDLLNALRCRLRRRMLAEKRRRGELVGDSARLDTHTFDGRDELLRKLVDAIDAGVTDVDLLYARSVLGHSTAELAAALGVSNGVLHRRLVLAARPYVATSS